MDYQEKRKLDCIFNNPDMSDISERLVFTYPYTDHETNVYCEETKPQIGELIHDKKVIDELLRLKYQFINNKEGLIHGDLHSGSIFVKGNEIKILDSEFALFGPIAYDIGNVIAHLYISKIGKDEAYSTIMNDHILYLTRSFEEKAAVFISKNTQDETLHEAYVNHYINNIIADSYKYAGLEIIRRTIGTAKTSELQLADPKLQQQVEKDYLDLGKELLLSGKFISDKE